MSIEQETLLQEFEQIRGFHSGPVAGGFRAGFQGAAGAYSEIAIERFFETGLITAKPVPVAFGSFREVFLAVEQGAVDIGVLPIENALTGSIHENYDLVLEFPDICMRAETYLRIRHNLIGIPGATIADIRRVYSHPQGLLQCQEFIGTNRLEAVPHFDTAGAVAFVRDQHDKSLAAIASSRAASVYNLSIIREGIETNSHNYTRFGVFCKKSQVLPISVREALKASVVFRLHHKPGSLLAAMSTFGARGINLTKIESRPIPGSPWQYMFYLDLELGNDFGAFSVALSELQSICQQARVLGLYSKADFTLEHQSPVS